MLRLVARRSAVLIISLFLAATSAHARNGGGHGGSHHGGHGHFHGHGGHHVVIVGAGGWWWGLDPWWWYYAPPYYAYWQTVIVEPSVYVDERPIAPTTEQFWYYCQAVAAYYPTARTCPEPWITVTIGRQPMPPPAEQFWHYCEPSGAYCPSVQTCTEPRDANDNVRISEDNRWAEPLESGIAQVLSDNLAAQLGSERITVLPGRGGVARLLDYQIVVVVLRFDASPDRDVTLDVRWRLLGKDGRELALRRSTLNEGISGGGYQSIVRGMNRTLARLAQEIATEIQSRAETRAAGS